MSHPDMASVARFERIRAALANVQPSTGLSPSTGESPSGLAWSADRIVLAVTAGTARPVSLNAERSTHWAVSARDTKAWVDAAMAALVATNWAHRQRWEAAIFTFTPHYRTGPLPDTGNTYPSCKAIVDGFVTFGVIPDDGPAHVPAIVLAAPVLDDWTGMAVVADRGPVAVGHGARGRCGCRSVWSRSQLANKLKARTPKGAAR